MVFVRTATWYGAGWFHWWTWKCLEDIIFILPIFSQQVTNRYITDKWIPSILEVGRKTSCFQPRFHKKNLTPTSAGCFFHQNPMKNPTSDAGDLRLLPSGRFAYILDGWPFLICCQEKIRAQTVWENHRWIRQRCHTQIRHVFLQKRWWHWYLMLRLFQAMAKTLIFHKLPFLHRFGCF